VRLEKGSHGRALHALEHAAVLLFQTGSDDALRRPREARRLYERCHERGAISTSCRAGHAEVCAKGAAVSGACARLLRRGTWTG